MLATLSLAFKEYLEVFLIIGILYAISNKLQPEAKKFIKNASITGVCFALVIPVIFFIFGNTVTQHLSENNIDLFESIVMIFSALFLAYVTISLHSIFYKNRNKIILETHKKIEHNLLDKTLFSVITLLIAREGLEIGLFTASVSLVSSFIANIVGLCIGFLFAAIIAYLIQKAMIKISLQSLFSFTQWIILIQGAALLQNGVSKLFNSFLHSSITFLTPINISILSSDSVITEFIKSFTGLSYEYSLLKLVLSVTYIATVYYIIKKYARS